MSNREKNATASFGKLTIKPSEVQPDLEKFDIITVNQANDGDLAEALARRGYDVTCTFVPPGTLKNRAEKVAKKMAARAKRDAAQGES